jgi:hypothetical protein
MGMEKRCSLTRRIDKRNKIPGKTHNMSQDMLFLFKPVPMKTS